MHFVVCFASLPDLNGGISNMIHYSCDRCKRTIDSEMDLRYVVKIEIQAAMDPPGVDETEEDRDHLHELQEILGQLEDESAHDLSEAVTQRRTFDLCSECFRKYSKNPIGRELSAQIGFSKN